MKSKLVLYMDGYIGSIHYDENTELYYGHILNSDDVYMADSLDGLHEVFEKTVEEHESKIQEFCRAG